MVFAFPVHCPVGLSVTKVMRVSAAIQSASKGCKYIRANVPFHNLVPGLAIIVSKGCVSCTVHAFTCASSLGGIFSAIWHGV